MLRLYADAHDGHDGPRWRRWATMAAMGHAGPRWRRWATMPTMPTMAAMPTMPTMTPLYRRIYCVSHATGRHTMHTDKYKGKYRIASTRLASWDYGRNAAYFITICTHQRLHVFGTVVEGQVDLTPLGQATWDCWYAIPKHFPFVLLDEFVAMPNHVHGIVIIDKPSPNAVETQNIASPRRNIASPRRNIASPRRNIASPRRNIASFGPQSQNLASIVRGFKIGVTKYARQHQIAFAWQERYHDHIVRDAAECQRIRKYIVENPQKWAADTFNTTP